MKKTIAMGMITVGAMGIATGIIGLYVSKKRGVK